MSLFDQPWMEDIPNDDVTHMTGLGLESNFSTLGRDRIFYYQRGIYGEISRPILVLLHGYPQTNFTWRHIIPLLPKDIPLFIPDVYGYGRSMGLLTPHDNSLTCANLLNTLSLHLHPALASRVPIIFVGHDRGARICHRLAVDATRTSSLNIVGTILLDIVPTLVQFQSFSTPSSSVSTFHWPFLANVELASEMIGAFGGDNWVRMCIDRWAGKDKKSLASLKSDKAVDVYAQFFKKPSVIHHSCDDYRAGSNEDVKKQEKDQKAGRKIDIDVLVLYSADYLGKRYDVKKVWEEWMGKGDLQVQNVGDGCGHFIAEEKPQECAAAVVKFYESF
ncbi:alpha/beta-hydrolase [Mollisia scopiformis]|uniref:Alpha/beta-hydrolase n=1 Tax=Mollisia scopiformis TaxID=149040 RepID=A0A194XB81_MOLSC|nr:alpha/beta-hydrolase [Mollisia scopiformis]KUJ17017.1 alpha/beta-hydrolase [Mollisia scopiformis]